jgi:hypothetical protein
MPCRHGMRGCREGCRHRESVLAYRDARSAALAACEDVCKGWETEHNEICRPKLITFKRWLTGGYFEREGDSR